jgi:CRP/FNR family transcriptional regulator, cyclic AMP receptor protein
MSVTLDALQKVPFLSHVQRKDLNNLAETMAERDMPAGKEIVTQGKGGVAFFLILDGKATVLVDGEERRQLGPSDHFGEIALIVPDIPRTSTVRADTDMRLAALTAWNFKPFVMKNPDVAWALLEELAKRFAATPRA